MLNRPGFHTSEFLAAAVNLIVQVALAWHGTITDGSATKYTVAGAIAFILSRGLAKYEPRGAVVLPPAVTAAAPPTPAPPAAG